MAKSLSEKVTSTAEGMAVWQQERAIFEITERICELMEEQGVTRAELAKRLNTSRGYVSQLLDGSSNMTIRKLSDVFLALGRQFHAHDGPIKIECDDGPQILQVSWHPSRQAKAQFQINPFKSRVGSA